MSPNAEGTQKLFIICSKSWVRMVGKMAQQLRALAAAFVGNMSSSLGTHSGL